MNTLFLIMAEFETAEIPLALIAEKYLGLNPDQAKRRALRQALPFPVHRGAKSQKAPWLVHAQDLANHLDAQREEAAREWKAINQAA
ncbi:MAG: pyocin activator protein PrtN [Alcanivoracaceae bacterium]|nr:pyocin activator protein PrtN [Alcanivoracaceae bacterium]|tara:strand:- start:4597 stop:4857 length:261 start_codon:yes stop_codon:yes gene_type:complete